MPPADRDDPAAATPAAGRAHERLLVRVGPERFALPAACVLEALVAPPLHALPALGGDCLGLLAWRGCRLPVRCPTETLGQAARRPAGAVLVLRGGSGAVAVAVDEVLDVRTTPPERVRPVPGLRDPFGVVRGAVVDDEGLVAHLAPDALADALAPAPAAGTGEGRP